MAALATALVLGGCGGPVKPPALPANAFDPRAKVDSVQYADLEGKGAIEAVVVSSLPSAGGQPGEGSFAVSIWRFRPEPPTWEQLGGWEDTDLTYTRVTAMLARLLPGAGQQVVVAAQAPGNLATLNVVVLGVSDGTVKRYLTISGLAQGQAAVEGGDLVVRSGQYASGEARCCPGHTLVRRYRWDGRALAVSSSETVVQ